MANNTRSGSSSTLPLESIRVVDVTQAWAGPYAALFLADWGAEVILVESRYVHHPGSRGMQARPRKIPPTQHNWVSAYPNWEPGARPFNRAPGFNCHSRNKLGITIDLKRTEGQDTFLKLVGISDVVLENNPPHMLNKFGLDYEGLRKVRPDLVMTRMPAYGLFGPYSQYKAWGTHIEGIIGHTWIRGYEDVDHSLKDDVYPSDAVAGIMAALCTMIALRHRRATGQGQLIDMALAEGLPSMLPEAILDYAMNGRVHTAVGNKDSSCAPQGCYPCRGNDQWVTISISSDEEWQALYKAMNNPVWSGDSRFNTVLGRYRHQDELDQRLVEWTVDMESRDVMEHLQAQGIAAGVVMDEAQTYQDLQLQALRFFEDITHPEAGTHSYPSVIGRIKGIKRPPSTAAPCLGQHNAYVYKEVLGISEGQYAQLEASGHIGTDYAPEVR